MFYDVDVVVRSTTIPDHNVEVVEANALKYPSFQEQKC